MADEPTGPPVQPGAVNLLASVAGLQDRLMRLLKRAEHARDLRTALLAIREARGLLEFHGRLTGELSADGTRVVVQVSTATTGAHVEALRTRVLTKLLALSVAPIDMGAPVIDAAV